MSDFSMRLCRVLAIVCAAGLLGIETESWRVGMATAFLALAIITGEA